MRAVIRRATRCRELTQGHRIRGHQRRRSCGPGSVVGPTGAASHSSSGRTERQSSRIRPSAAGVDNQPAPAVIAGDDQALVTHEFQPRMVGRPPARPGGHLVATYLETLPVQDLQQLLQLGAGALGPLRFNSGWPFPG